MLYHAASFHQKKQTCVTIVQRDCLSCIGSCLLISKCVSCKAGRAAKIGGVAGQKSWTCILGLSLLLTGYLLMTKLTSSKVACCVHRTQTNPTIATIEMPSESISFGSCLSIWDGILTLASSWLLPTLRYKDVALHQSWSISKRPMVCWAQCFKTCEILGIMRGSTTTIIDGPCNDPFISVDLLSSYTTYGTELEWRCVVYES